MHPLTATQKAWQEKVNAFCREFVEPTVIERDQAQIFDRQLVDKVMALGIPQIAWPKEYGGLGEDYISYMVAWVYVVNRWFASAPMNKKKSF